MNRSGEEDGARRHVALIGGVIIAPTALLLLLRWTSIAHPLVIALVGLTPLLIVPILMTLFLLALSRDGRLGIVAVITLLGWMFTVTPWSGVIGCRADDGPPDVTVLTMNTLHGRADPLRVAELVDEHSPDVFLLQEATPDLVARLGADERLDDYWSRSDPTLTDGDGVAMWSRHEWRDLHRFETGGRSVPQAIIEAPQGEFTVTAVHSPTPTTASLAAQWKQHFVDLRNLQPDTRHLLIGDFNATKDHGAFRSLLGAGWTDVHDSKGCGFDATWPIGSGAPLPFAVYRLDHVLMNDGFDVLSIEIIDDTGGSDHKALVAHLRFTEP